MHTKNKQDGAALEISEMKKIILDMFAKGLSTVHIARVLKTMSGYALRRQ